MTMYDKRVEDFLMVIGIISESDLVSVNKIARAVKNRRSKLNEEILSGFNIGDVVSFEDGGRIYNGTVIKRMLKRIKVDVGDCIWHVHPTALTKEGDDE